MSFNSVESLTVVVYAKNFILKFPTNTHTYFTNTFGENSHTYAYFHRKVYKIT